MLTYLAAAVSTVPIGVPWNTEVTIVGLLVVLILFISFGVLYPRNYVKRLERKMDFDEETIERNTLAIEKIASSLESKGTTDQTVEKIMKALQSQKLGDP